MKFLVETDRLLLREFQLNDIDGFYELDSDPEVHRYLGNKPVQDKDFLVQVIKTVQQQYIDNGIGRWSVIEKSTGEFVGWSGLKLNKDTINNQINFYDLGYRIKRKLWGHGYATESAMAALNYGFSNLNANIIYANTHFNNSASERVLLKCGLSYVENFLEDRVEHKWYQIEKYKFYNPF